MLDQSFMVSFLSPTPMHLQDTKLFHLCKKSFVVYGFCFVLVAFFSHEQVLESQHNFWSLKK